MKHLCSIILPTDLTDPKPIAISPQDNVWFVAADACPPQYQEWLKGILGNGTMQCLGHIFISDDAGGSEEGPANEPGTSAGGVQ